MSPGRLGHLGLHGSRNRRSRSRILKSAPILETKKWNIYVATPKRLVGVTRYHLGETIDASNRAIGEGAARVVGGIVGSKCVASFPDFLCKTLENFS